MNSTSQGFLFETLALAYLERHGLLFVARNFSGRYGEIDLIMKDQTQLVFVEVKYRKSSNYGGPLAAITASKQQKLRLTATAYLQQHAPKAYARFDVIAISGDEPFHFEWLKNAF
jgi:putative endonuclease